MPLEKRKQPGRAATLGGVASITLLLLVAVLVEAPGARAGVSFEASVTPTTVRFPGTSELTYELRMSTGRKRERFAVLARPPRYGSISRRGREGSPVTTDPRHLELDGPGRFGPLIWMRIDRLACAGQGVPPHGHEPTSLGVDVKLPPRSTSTLRIGYGTGRFAPWPDLSYRVKFVARPRPIAGGRKGTIRRRRVVRSPQPSLAGQTGVHIFLDTEPHSALNGEARKVERGEPIAIFGRTVPPIGGQILQLLYFGPGREGAPGIIGLVLVRPDGTFRFEQFRPLLPGFYSIWARYTTQQPGLVSDYACPRFFEVT